MKRRNVVQLISTLPLIAAGNSYATEKMELPDVIKFIVPYSPGGSNDVFARALAQKLTTDLKVKFVVENKPGAGGATGATFVASSAGDGANLLLGSNSMVMNAVVQLKPQYDPVSSFATVAILNRGPNLILVSRNSRFNDLQALFQAMKSGEVKDYGSAGIGSAAHLVTEMLNRELNTNVQHIPYKGITNALTDMIGSNVDMVIATPASASGQLKAGFVKALGITSLTPSSFYPDLITFSKLIPNFDMESWWGVFASAKTPPKLVEYLNQKIITACKDPFMTSMFQREATIPVDMDVKAASHFVAVEKDRWAKVAKLRNITSNS